MPLIGDMFPTCMTVMASKQSPEQKSQNKPHLPIPPIQTSFLDTHHWHGQNTQIIMTNNF